VRARVAQFAIAVESAIEDVLSDYPLNKDDLDALDAYYGWASKCQIREIVEEIIKSEQS